jgi:hypothetical protein
MSIFHPNRRKNRQRDKAFLAWIHLQPCAVAAALVAPLNMGATRTLIVAGCSGRITAHHAGTRGLMQKADDRTAIPLCEAHHQHGPKAVHRIGKQFWNSHGIDRDELIAGLNAKFEAEYGMRALTAQHVREMAQA